MYLLDIDKLNESIVETLCSADVADNSQWTQHLETYNGGDIYSSQPLVVDLGTQLWANCARFSIEINNASKPPVDAHIELCARATDGCIQIFLSDNDGVMLSDDVRISPLSGPTTITLALPAVGSCHVVFANATPDRKACRCHLISLRALSAPTTTQLETAMSAGAESFSLDGLFTTLKDKWCEIPAADARQQSANLLQLSDRDLKAFWEQKHHLDTCDAGFRHRGWYQMLYRERLAGKRVADIGSGMGLDGIYFGRNGAEVTFVDLSESNLELIQRLCALYNIKGARFVLLENPESLDQLDEYDVIWCQGSMINAPFEIMAVECRKILEHLPVGGHWVELAYPRERWQREGSLPFNQWGKFTDGENTPWMEWYDRERLLARLSPARFDTLLDFNFHNDDFVWFELRRTH